MIREPNRVNFDLVIIIAFRKSAFSENDLSDGWMITWTSRPCEHVNMATNVRQRNRLVSVTFGCCVDAISNAKLDSPVLFDHQFGLRSENSVTDFYNYVAEIANKIPKKSIQEFSEELLTLITKCEKTQRRNSGTTEMTCDTD